MEMLVWPGAAVVMIGIGGLVYCMIQAQKVKSSGLEGTEMTQALQRLVAVNLGSICVAAIGMMMVVIGLLL